MPDTPPNTTEPRKWARVEWMPAPFASNEDKRKPWPVTEGLIPSDWDEAKVREELQERAGFSRWPFYIERVTITAERQP